MADGYAVSAGQKISLQKNKVYANYCNRNQHNNCVGLTKTADMAVQLINCGGPGGTMGTQLIH